MRFEFIENVQPRTHCSVSLDRCDGCDIYQVIWVQYKTRWCQNVMVINVRIYKIGGYRKVKNASSSFQVFCKSIVCFEYIKSDYVFEVRLHLIYENAGGVFQIYG